MTREISGLDKVRLFLIVIPKYWLYDFPRRLIYFAKVLLKADNLASIIGSIEVNEMAEDAILHELNEQDHAWLEVKDRVVIDLGAYVGDTAILFAKKGAKHVYAYEARCNVAEIGKGFVKQYGYEEIITLECDFIDSTKFNRLAEVLQLENAALKVDIEGGEREVILNASSRTLKRFDVMHIECHYGYLDIKKRLENEGFKVTRANLNYSWRRREESMILCDLYARRN